MSTSKGKKADTLAKGHAKSTADRNKSEMKNESGMFVLPLSRLRLLYMAGLTSSTVSEAGGLVVSSKRRLTTHYEGYGCRHRRRQGSENIVRFIEHFY